MLSVVVVGRNDSHGYNLNKRVSTSLNSIASTLLTGDEIIFVDWNTPNTLPAMPLAIQSDLTQHCRSLLKVVRVSSRIHDSIKKSSNKPLLEPFARNVGIRFSDENNEWVLSTNTDMIFLTHMKKFQDILVNLEKKLWTSYRYELPEFMWETLDSRDPNEITLMLNDWHSKFDLSRSFFSELKSKLNYKLVDAVGDFQLAPRAMWCQLRGFPEDMLNGWHVDSRVSVAFQNITNETAGIFQDNELITYHQNHLRTLTNYHSGQSNDPSLALEKYTNDVNWGLNAFDLSKVEFEELANINKVLDSIRMIDFSHSNEEQALSSIEKRKTYELSHISLYLADSLMTIPPSQNILLLTTNSDTLDFILSIVQKNHNLFLVNVKEAVNLVLDLVIIDFGISRDSLSNQNFQELFDNLDLIVTKIGDANTIFTFIRVQNWGIRTLVKYYFDLPLFNNYTQVLTGRRKSKLNRSLSGRIGLIAAYWGMTSDYAATNATLRNFSSMQVAGSKVFKILWQAYKKLPFKARSKIRALLME